MAIVRFITLTQVIPRFSSEGSTFQSMKPQLSGGTMETQPWVRAERASKEGTISVIGYKTVLRAIGVSSCLCHLARQDAGHELDVLVLLVARYLWLFPMNCLYLVCSIFLSSFNGSLLTIGPEGHDIVENGYNFGRYVEYFAPQIR